MKNLSTFDIAIIGGGMVGMSLALLLARANPAWKLALVDAQVFSENETNIFQPGFDARSTAVAQGSMEIFQSLGVWKKLSEQATAIRKIHVSDAGHFMGGLINADDYAVDALGYVIPNEWISKVLLAEINKIENVQLFSSTRVEKITHQQSNSVLQIVEISSGNMMSLETQLVIMADGGQSKLAQSLGIDFNVQPYQQTAIIANLAFTQAHQQIAYERFTELGPIALLPLSKSASATEAALVLTLPQDQAEQILNSSDQEFLAHLQKRFGNRLGTFTRVGKRYAYPLQLVTAKEQVRSHLVLIGNAAHFYILSQARDLIYLCVTQLVWRRRWLNRINHRATLGFATLFGTTTKRSKHYSFFSDQLVKLFSNSRLPVIALRHLGFLGLESIPFLKNMLVNQTMGKAS